MEVTDYLDTLIKKENLSRKQSERLVEILISDQTSPVQTAAVLTALASKGETVDEIAGFIDGMQKLMLQVNGVNDAIDIVGTGGDASGSFNISTVSALVVASCGAKVAKHGNRAASSKCGSADLLEALGADILLTPQKAQTVLQKAGFVFLFAPQFHPAMKAVGKVRRELKIRTIFNYLGPFLNPGKVSRMVLGVANLELAKKFLEIARKLNFEHLLIVTSVDGMDEISVASETHAFELKNGKARKFIIDPKKLGFKKYSKQELIGGDPKLNSEIAKNILSGKEQGAKRDAVILNSAYALIISGKVKNVKDGIKLASEAIDSGTSLKLLKQFIKETNK